MKRIVAITLSVAFVGSLLWTNAAQAITARSGDRPEITKNEVLDSSAYIAGSHVAVDGTIKGDLYCAGQEVVVTGIIEGDLLCAAQNIRVSGTVQGDIRVAGQSVLLSGKVDGSVSVLSQMTTIEATSVIAKDLTVMSGQSSKISGSVGRDAVLNGDHIIINGKIGRDVTAEAKNLTLRQATVAGNLHYTSEKQVSLEQNSVVSGQTQRYEPPAKHEPTQTPAEKYFAGPLYWFAAFALIGLVLLVALRRPLEKQSEASLQRPFFTLGLGLVGLIALPFVSILAFLSIAGVPLGFIIGALWISVIMASFPVTGYVIGSFISKKIGWEFRALPFVSLFVGLLVLMILVMIPVLGGLILIMALLWGAGTLALAFTVGSKKTKKD